MYNVKLAPYNATGNGVTDDWAAIRSAILAAQAAGGGQVYFPEGNYLISDTLPLYGKVHLMGMGVCATTITLKANTNKKMLYGNLVEDCMIACLTLQGAKASGNSGAGTYGIHLESPKRVTVADAGILSTGESAVYLTGTPVDCTIRDVYVDDAGQYESIRCDAGTEVVRCTVRRATGKCILVGADSAVRDCTLVAPAANVGGIYVSGSRSVVEGNRLDWTSATAGTGISCKTEANDVVITGNRYVGNSASGGSSRAGIHVGVSAVAPAVPDNKRCTITSNVIDGGTADGILLGVGTSDTGSDCVVSGNVVSGVGLSGAAGDLGVGIETHYDRTDIAGNVVTGCSGHGFFLEGSFNTVADNLSAQNGQGVNDAAGIKIISSFTTCSGNTCVDNGGGGTATAGVLVASDAGAISDVMVAGNTCTDTRSGGSKTQDYGIAFTGTAGSVTRAIVDGNSIEGNGTAPLLTTSLASAAIGRNSASAITSVSANYTASVLDEVVLANPAGGNVTITLPTAARIAGFQIAVRNTNLLTNTVSLAPAGSETIDGAGTAISLNATRPAVTVVSDGANWHSI